MVTTIQYTLCKIDIARLYSKDKGDGNASSVHLKFLNLESQQNVIPTPQKVLKCPE